jgi:hypothetical protein
VTYCQLLSFMSDLRIYWPPIIVEAFDILGRYTSPTLQISSVDCAIQAGSTVSPYFGRLVALAAVPLITVLGAGLCWLMVWGIWSTPQYQAASAWWQNKLMNRRLAALNRKNLKRAARGAPEVSDHSQSADALGAATLSPEGLRSHVKTNFLITSMALLFLQHSSLTKAAFSFFSCR